MEPHAAFDLNREPLYSIYSKSVDEGVFSDDHLICMDSRIVRIYPEDGDIYLRQKPLYDQLNQMFCRAGDEAYFNQQNLANTPITGREIKKLFDRLLTHEATLYQAEKLTRNLKNINTASHPAFLTAVLGDCLLDALPEDVETLNIHSLTPLVAKYLTLHVMDLPLDTTLERLKAEHNERIENYTVRSLKSHELTEETQAILFALRKNWRSITPEEWASINLLSPQQRPERPVGAERQTNSYSGNPSQIQESVQRSEERVRLSPDPVQASRVVHRCRKQILRPKNDCQLLALPATRSKPKPMNLSAVSSVNGSGQSKAVAVPAIQNNLPPPNLCVMPPVNAGSQSTVTVLVLPPPIFSQQSLPIGIVGAPVPAVINNVSMATLPQATMPVLNGISTSTQPAGLSSSPEKTPIIEITDDGSSDEPEHKTQQAKDSAYFKTKPGPSSETKQGRSKKGKTKRKATRTSYLQEGGLSAKKSQSSRRSSPAARCSDQAMSPIQRQTDNPQSSPDITDDEFFRSLMEIEALEALPEMEKATQSVTKLPEVIQNHFLGEEAPLSQPVTDHQRQLQLTGRSLIPASGQSETKEQSGASSSPASGGTSLSSQDENKCPKCKKDFTGNLKSVLPHLANYHQLRLPDFPKDQWIQDLLLP